MSRERQAVGSDREPPRLRVDGKLNAALLARSLTDLVAKIPVGYVQNRRWFGSKTRTITELRLYDEALLPDQVDQGTGAAPAPPTAGSPDVVGAGEAPHFVLAIVDVHFAVGDSERYFVPFALRPRMRSDSSESGSTTAGGGRHEPVLIVEAGGTSWVGYEALADPDLARRLLGEIVAGEEIATTRGHFKFRNTPVLARLGDGHGEVSGQTGGERRPTARPSASPLLELEARVLGAEQSNTSIVYGNALILKSFRKLQPGLNPELEIGRFLTTRTGFEHIPLLAGYVEYADTSGYEASVGVLQHFVPSEGDGWSYTLEHLRTLYAFGERTLAEGRIRPNPDAETIAESVRCHASAFLRDVRRLGEITAQLHDALASVADEPAFAPEPVEADDLERWGDELTRHVGSIMDALAVNVGRYPGNVQEQIRRVTAARATFEAKLESLRQVQTGGLAKTRYHGDYHLGQVLKTPDGFVILDFEGEPARSLQERRAKHSPLKDVAGMLRSFNYAVYAGLRERGARDGGMAGAGENDGAAPQLSGATLERWGRVWEQLVREAYLEGYFGATPRSLAGASRADVDRLIEVFELDKAIYELGYELNNRPDWLSIPLTRVAEIGGEA